MREVAAKARVSTATVSKCLRGVPGVSEQTRERVRQIATRLGYRPHPYVSALMQNRRKRQGAAPPNPVLAFVTAFPEADGWLKAPSPLLRLLHAGARERAGERGYTLGHFWLHQDGMSSYRFGEMLHARGIRGVMLPPFPDLNARIDMAWSHFSVVSHGLTVAHPVFHRTSNDHYQSMMLALQECRRRGYRRPGFAMDGPLGERLECRWEAAFLTGRAKMGFDTGVEPHFFSSWDAGATAKWLRREKPDVLISLLREDHIAELKKHGVRIPRDLGGISLSVHEQGGPLSGIHQNARLMGVLAIDKLVDLVERGESGVPTHPLTLTIDGVWNEGETLRSRIADGFGANEGI